MKSEIEKLVYVSRAIGRLPELVQGGGGNTSMKDADSIMYIKSSGIPLRKMTTKSGFVAVDSKGTIMGGSDEEKPSMETGMHLHLSKCVIHTHPTYVNVFTCMKNGKRHLQKLFLGYDPMYILYKSPGENLAREIKVRAEHYRERTHRTPQIIFLENHGLITCDGDPHQALKLTFRVNAIVKNYLKKMIPNFKPFDMRQSNVEAPKQCLFPDAAVFKNGKHVQSAKEIFSAHEYTLRMIRESGNTPRYLNKREEKFLQNMENEKYRIQVSTSN